MRVEEQPKKKANYWVKSGILTLFQNFSVAFMGAIGIMILARLLTKSEFGVWGLFLSTGTILEMVRNGLIQSAVIKFIASRPEDEKEIFSAALVISGTLTVLCILLIVCFGRLLSVLLKTPEMEQLLYWYIPWFLVSGVLTQLCCIEQAHFSYKGVVACNTVRSAGFFTFLVISFVLQRVPTVMEMVYVQLLSMVTAMIVTWFYVKKYVVRGFAFSMDWVKRILNYGKYAFGTSLSSLLSGTIDQIMIGSIINTASVASFRLSIQVINLMDIPTNTIATIVFPQSARRMETDGKEAIKYLYERSVGAILAVLIPAVVFLFIFAEFIMGLFAGSKYLNAVPILHVTLLYALLIPYGRQFGAILDSIGKIKTTFFMVVFTATLNLVLNFYFIRTFGVIGAAWATLISNVVGFAIAQYILYKELGVNALHPFIYAWQFYTEFYKKYLKKYLAR